MGWVTINKYIANMERYHRSWSKKEGHEDHVDFKNIERFKLWCMANNVDKWFDGDINWTYLNPSGKYIKDSNVNTPGQDHIDLFKTSTGEKIFVSQPYGIDLFTLLAWASSTGIKIVKGDSLSWHSNNYTHLIEYRLDDLDEFESALQELKY
ncbi:hypothetical protein [Clostridium sulfidigenes]|uniref:hypothetical protein n=1 Tax=Clostridium sulfidigenes TaxID=318464 RepID=UPI003F89022F